MEMAAAALIILHGPDGHEIRISPQQITSLHAPKQGAKVEDKLYAPALKCLVNLTDGKSVTVVETCIHVENLLHEATK